MAFTLAAAFLFAIASIIIGRFTAKPFVSIWPGIQTPSGPASKPRKERRFSRRSSLTRYTPVSARSLRAQWTVRKALETQISMALQNLLSEAGQDPLDPGDF
jgi:hypothetical protein